MSRNIGIGLAAGEAVAFIDDDAYPDPAWLDELVAGLWSAEDVAVTGGPVFDHTGVQFQARYCLANRLGEAWISAGPNPTDWLASPYSARYRVPDGHQRRVPARAAWSSSAASTRSTSTTLTTPTSPCARWSAGTS